MATERALSHKISNFQMEFEFHPFTLSFLNLLLLFAFLFLIWRISSKTYKITKKLPPGPRKMPLIGNIHNLIGGHPHHILRDLAEKYGPLMHLQLGEVSTVVVSSAELAKEVLVTRDPAFADRPARLVAKILWNDQPGVVFSAYSDHWRQLRKICIMELLSGKNVGSFSFIRKDEVSKLAESIRSSIGVPINLTERIFAYTSSMTGRASFGRISKDNKTLVNFSKIVMALLAGFNVADIFPSLKILPIISGFRGKLVKMHHRIDEILDDVINQHKVNHRSGKKGNAESGDEDLIDILLRHQESGNLQTPITSKLIKAVLLDIFVGGTDTSSVVTEWVMAELMKHPNVMTKAQVEVREVCKGKKNIEEADIKKLMYLKMVIRETLRLHPPIPLIPRECKENCEVNRYIIPNKSQVLVNAWAIGRDARYWDDPESFKPERFEQSSIEYTGSEFQYIPFGAGKRMCPGIAFGLANIEIPLAHLLYHFDWGLPYEMKPNDLDMNEGTGLTVGRKQDLYLVATAYYPSWND